MSFAGRRVLVVDDEFLASMATVDLLEGAECVIIGPAGRLPEAARLAQTETIDAAVLDVNMAGERVWPIAQILRDRGIPFLFLSAYPKVELPKDFAAVPCLVKPVEDDRLLVQMAALLARSPVRPAI